MTGLFQPRHPAELVYSEQHLYKEKAREGDFSDEEWYPVLKPRGCMDQNEGPGLSKMADRSVTRARLQDALIAFDTLSLQDFGALQVVSESLTTKHFIF